VASYEGSSGSVECPLGPVRNPIIRLVGLTLRAFSLVATGIAAYSILCWLGAAFQRPPGSGPNGLFGIVGIVAALIGIICRVAASRLLRRSAHDNAA
jgi:hypothetical protein